MEALYIQPWEEEDVTAEERELGKRGRREEGGLEASSPDEDTDEDSDPGPSPVIRRKVSFADAFGLDLVSVKEFDNAEAKDPEVSPPLEKEATRPLEDFYITCLFAVPSTPEELDQRLQAQMVELESIELLPGTTSIRGTIRVVNLCYSKSVHARVSLDRWQSYFDLLAEYVPGSSDRRTDRFTFQYALVPPFEREGTRVEICLRYDTSAGTFWANNKAMNYVLFCHQRGHAGERGPRAPEGSKRSKRSCLKASRSGSAEEKTRETGDTSPAVAHPEASDKAEEADRETQSLLRCEEQKPLVDGIRSRRRATRRARAPDYLTQRSQHVPGAYSHDSAGSREMCRPLPTPRGDSATFLHKRPRRRSNEGPRVLTYHEIPLLTLDWSVKRPHQRGTAESDDVWAGRSRMTLTKAPVENIDETPSVTDVWEMFCNGTDDTAHQEISVCDVWQQFLNGSSGADHAGVPESEWLQTAASVSPSNDKGCKARHAGTSRGRDSQAGSDARAHIAVPRQLLSDVCKASADNDAWNGADDDEATRDASRGSETNLETDALREFSPGGETPASEDDGGNSTERRKHSMWERDRERIIEGAEGIGGDDSVTSSGEQQTTDMAATAECLNASAVDRISDGARLQEGLSSSREGQATGTQHNVMDDRLAFRETVRRATESGERFVFATSKQGEEEAAVGEEIFRPQKTEECEIPQRYAGEKQREEFRPNRSSEGQSESDGDETRSHVTDVGAHQSRGDDFERQREESGNKDAASDNEGKETRRVTGAEAGIELALNEKARDERSTPIRSSQNEEEEDSKPTHIQDNVGLKHQSEEGKRFSCDGITERQQDINPSVQTRPTVESRETIKVLLSDRDTSRPFPSDKCNPTPLEETKMRHSHDDTQGQKEDVGRGISPDEVTTEEDAATKYTSTELQRRHETLARSEDVLSCGDKDERVRVGAPGEAVGDVGISRGETRRNAPAQSKAQELSAEVESSPRVECERLSEGTRDPNTAENAAPLEMMFIEGFVDDLLKGIWEEVFNRTAQVSKRDLNTVGGRADKLADVPDSTQDCPPSEKDLNDALESSVFALAENSSLCRGLEQTLAAKSVGFSPEERSQPVVPTEQTHLHPELERDSDSGARFSQDPASSDRSNHPRIKERSVARQETARQTGELVVAHKESFDPSEPPGSSSEKLKESAWWSVLYVLVHVTRLLTCALLVAAFFYVVFLCDFPAFFALYVFSLGWWFYRWRGHRATTDKAMVE